MSKEPQPFETYIIKHKDTGAIWQAPSGKTSWKAKGHAKNAWASQVDTFSGYQSIQINRCESLGIDKVFSRQYEGVNYYRVPYFDEQETYVLVRLEAESTILTRLQEAENLLKDILNNYEAGESIDNQIKRFLKIEI